MFVAVILSVGLLASVKGEDLRVAGGNSVDIQKYPFSVSLVTNGGQGTSYSHGCGGTILTSQAILSAASCFYTDANAHPVSWWRARVGSTYSNSGGSIHLINRITPHPEFSPASLAHDIALLRPTVALVLVPGAVQAARVSGPLYTFALHQVVTAIGWGAVSNQDPSPSRELREVEVYSIDQTTCTNRWSELNVTITSDMVCTGWLDVGVIGQCVGDVGSPLLDREGGFVVGVFSRAEGCAQSWHPDVNTRLQPYLPWITVATYQ